MALPRAGNRGRGLCQGAIREIELPHAGHRGPGLARTVSASGRLARRDDGVDTAALGGQVWARTGDPLAVGGRVRIDATLEAAADSDAAEETVSWRHSASTTPSS
ncbi:hypothetical protein [Streptomyces cahuitamycinicus]|uniref:hypothetical protein n=1 Tax=Streptomyces cahuitamycinicus TaxID=2070367 RepID=UPI0026BC4FC0